MNQAQLPLSLTGRVVRGAARGAGLGFPTANLDASPANLRYGIYAGYVTAIDAALERHPTLIYWGQRPTFDGGPAGLELYLLDWSGTLYDRTLTVLVQHFLRPDQAFDSKKALQLQMDADVATARKVLRVDNPKAV